MILTVARDEALRERVVTALRDTPWSGSVTAASGVGEAEQLMAGPTPPNVVIVGESVGVPGASDLAARAATMRHPPAVLLVGEPTTEVLRAAMRAGVRDVLPEDFTTDDLVRVFEEAGVDSGGPTAVPGLTVAIFSTKGGVGTSVLASNLATRLASRSSAATTLVDLDLASADQSIMHGLSPRWTIQDLADGQVGLDAESLKQVLLPVEGSSARLLPGPVDPALAETISAGQVASVIAAVRAEAPFAVLDTASGFDDRTLAGLDAADVVVLTSSLDVAALRSLTVSLQALRRLGIGDDDIVVVVARSDSKSGLLLSDVERALDRQVDVGIPSTRLVPRSLNEGIPLAVSSPRSDVVEAVDELVDLLLVRAPDELRPERERDQSRGGFLPWSRSKSEPPARDRNEDPSGVELPPAATGPPEPPPVDAPTDEVVLDPVPTEEGADVVELAEGLRPIRRVQRPVREPEPDAEDEEVPRVRATSRLEALPPPTIVTDDEDDDQPRRRRRR